MPLWCNLLIVDFYVKEGYELGIITARGEEDLIAEILPKWLNINLKNNFPIMIRSNIHAIAEDKYTGDSPGDRKLKVLLKHMESGKYTNIYFMDDNIFTNELIQKYNKTANEDKKVHLLNVV